MKRLALLGVTFAVSLAPMLCGCSQSGGNGWIEAKNNSPMDGVLLTATHDYKFSDHQTFIRVVLTCVPASQNLVVSLQSYKSAKNKSGTYDGLAIKDSAEADEEGNVLDIPLGRVKFRDSQPIPLRTLFLIDDRYSNVMSWRVSQFALAYAALDRIKERESAASQDDKDNDNWNQLLATGAEELAERMGHPINEGTKQKLKLMRESKLILSGHDQLSFHPGYELSWTKELYDSEFGTNSSTEVGSGNYLKQFLPIVFEVSNDAGTVNVQLPADDDPALKDVIAKCSVPEK